MSKTFMVSASDELRILRLSSHALVLGVYSIRFTQAAGVLVEKYFRVSQCMGLGFLVNIELRFELFVCAPIRFNGLALKMLRIFLSFIFQAIDLNKKNILKNGLKSGTSIGNRLLLICRYKSYLR